MHAKFSMVYIHLTSSRVHLAETWKSVELQIKGMKADQYFKTNVYAGNIFKTTKHISWSYTESIWLNPEQYVVFVCYSWEVSSFFKTPYYFYVRILNRF